VSRRFAILTTLGSLVSYLIGGYVFARGSRA